MYFSDMGHENVFLATFLLRSPRYFARRHSHYSTNLNISRNTVSWMFENVFISSMYCLHGANRGFVPGDSTPPPIKSCRFAAFFLPEVTSQTGSDAIIVKSCRFAAFFPTGSDDTTGSAPLPEMI